MKKEVEIEVPKNWSAITLKDYLELQKDIESYGDDENALTAILFHRLCNMPVSWINQLDIITYTDIKNEINSFLSKTEHPLKRIITIDGKEYGFEPNLSNMAYGAYVDISNYDTFAIDNKWAEIMSILYRPITNKVGSMYDIEAYSGNVNSQLFMHIGMDIHFGALFFLKDLLKELLKSTLKSLMEKEEMPANIKLILERNGNLIHH
jgi:hypothetical protein